RGTLFGKGSLAAVEHAKAFMEERHKIIASNIANVETRYYKAKDLDEDDFQRMLSKSLSERDQKHVGVFEMIHSRKSHGNWDGGTDYLVEESGGGILRHGDNNVDIDKEVAKMTRNQMMFRTMNRLAKKHY